MVKTGTRELDVIQVSLLWAPPIMFMDQTQLQVFIQVLWEMQICAWETTTSFNLGLD